MRSPAQKADASDGLALAGTGSRSSESTVGVNQWPRSQPVLMCSTGPPVDSKFQRSTILAGAPLETFTDRTLSTPPALALDLEQIRLRGYALDDEERHPGMRCIAAPVFNEFGEPIAGVSVSGPTVRMTPERVAALGPLVAEAAAEVTRTIGGRPPP